MRGPTIAVTFKRIKSVPALKESNIYDDRQCVRWECCSGDAKGVVDLGVFPQEKKSGVLNFSVENGLLIKFQPNMEYNSHCICQPSPLVLNGRPPSGQNPDLDP